MSVSYNTYLNMLIKYQISNCDINFKTKTNSKQPMKSPYLPISKSFATITIFPWYDACLCGPMDLVLVAYFPKCWGWLIQSKPGHTKISKQFEFIALSMLSM